MSRLADGQLKVVDSKKFYSMVLGLVALLVGVYFSPSNVSAAGKSKFFDFGPYYSQSQVLGLSLSVLENLPALQIPVEAIPPPAKGILPGSPFHFLEKAAESIQLTFTSDPIKKEELRINFADERLAEAKTLYDQGNTEAAASALDDYSQTVKVVAQNLSDQSLADLVEERLARAAVFAQSVILTSSPAHAENWTAALDASNKALDKAAEIKGVPAIPGDLSASIQSLKQNGLISEEESNKLYNFKSRGQVREELDKLTSSGQFPPSEITKLDSAVGSRYPQVQEQLSTNMQVVELRAYQSLPQPTKEVLKEIEEWQKDRGQTPPNDIKGYLWYNRAQDLARTVDLSNFPAEKQAEVAKFYSRAVAENPTYTPPPPSPSPTPQPSPTADVSPTPSPPPTGEPAPSTSAVSAELYVGGTGGALPGGLNYNIKRWNEELSLTFTFDPVQKARLKMQQAERRLAEAAALAEDPKKKSLIASVIEDYKSALDGASNYLKSAPESPQSREVAKKLESEAARHEVVFEKGLVSVAGDSKLISEAIKATEDAMDKAADAQDKIALPPVLSQRLGDLKAQGLLLPEEVDDLTRSNSREEVREKVRKLTEAGTFPPADAKKLDEAQLLTIPSEYNQLVEVRKVEELQNLRSAQAGFAQTPTLKATAATLGQQEIALSTSIEPALISEQDLKGRDDLVKTYRALVSEVRPINGGQFGSDIRPGATPSASPTPRPADAVLSVCPVGATFKQSEGCVWADSGKKLNDYDQYKCDGPRQYYSFAARKCVPYESGTGFRDDAQPVCQVGYTWSWQTQSCQTSTGGILPYPTPKPEEIKDEKEIEERSKTCPEGATYKSPNGCVWDTDGKKVYDSNQYRCQGPRQYYSFEEHKCVPAPKAGEEYPKDAFPSCKEPNARWSWTESKCVVIPEIPLQKGDVQILLDVPKPVITPDNPFYFVRRWGDAVELVTSFTPEAKAQTRISQAKDKLADSLYLLEKGDNELFDAILAEYTGKMQELYNDLAKSTLSDEAKKAVGQRLGTEAVTQNLLLQKAQVLAKPEQENSIIAASSATILGVDKAADFSGEPAIPDETRAKIEALPEKMVSGEDKKALLEVDSRIETRLKIGQLIANGALTAQDTAFLNEDLDNADPAAKFKLEELRKLEGIVSAKEQEEKIAKKVEENEKIVAGLTEFEKNFEENKEVPAEIRPYIRLTRIEEVAQTIRPDVVKLEDFQNRKDVVLAVATLQEEFKPTSQAVRQVQDFRRRNPGANLPPELARVEALSYSLGVRNQAEACFLPPPFPANTPCPAPGAAIPIANYTGRVVVDEFRPGWSGGPSASLDKDGKPLIYGQGPKSESAGVCPSGFHWMYDSGGWCMNNGGSYGPSNVFTPSGGGPGYTPYSPYYTAPGISPGTPGYPAPNYYGPVPTYYTTNPPAGTVPGTGPQPTSPGQCPSGFHWMSDSGGWCMSDAPTYVPGGPIPTGPYSPNLNQSSCGPGYYWDGKGCIPTTSRDTPPGPTLYNPYGSCQGISCGGGSYLDYSSCSCKYSPYSPNTPYSPTGPTSPGSCSPPSGGCGSGWFDSGSCSCKQASPQGCYNVSASSCGSGFYWDSGACTCRSNTPTSPTPSSPSPGGTSSGSCPSGYHWMSDNNGWCMSDGASGGGSTSPSPAPSPTTTSEPAPAPAPTTESAPAPAPAPAPASEPAPAPAPATTEPAPVPGT